MRVRQSLVRTMLALVALVSFTTMASVAGAAEPHAPLTVTVIGKTFTYAAPASFVTSASVVNTGAVQGWVSAVANNVDCKPADAKWWIDKKKRKIVFKTSRKGYKLDQAGATTAIINELLSEVASATAKPVALSATATNPKIVDFKNKKRILVSLKQRKVYLYNNMKLEKTYRCAVGMKAYPTPKGSFYIGKKRKNPDWHRGSAAWASSMPSYIGPGPSNPLGTRALYVYKQNGADTGVRFHGTTNTGSIGHAASHGCLRMKRKDVENFFPRVKIKTPVYIIN